MKKNRLGQDTNRNDKEEEEEQQQQQQERKMRREYIKSPEESVPHLFTFTAFPRYSVNIVAGPTFVGKTYYVTQLVNNYKIFFECRVGRVVVVLCNSRVKSISFSPDLDVPVEQVLLSDFAPDFLEENDLVIIDDLQHLTPEVKLTISVCAHHTALASLFVITHSLLGSSNFELLSLCHRIFLFLGSTANKRLTAYILDHFYSDPEVKTYLKSVLNYCSQQSQVLALELSPIGPSPQIVLAFSHLLQLLGDRSSGHSNNSGEEFKRGENSNEEEEEEEIYGSDSEARAVEKEKKIEKKKRVSKFLGEEETLQGFCLLYPSPHFGSTFASRFEKPKPGNHRQIRPPLRLATQSDGADKKTMSISFLHSDSTRNLPENALVALPVRYVVDQSSSAVNGTSASSSAECADRESWESTLQDIEDNIESFFPIKKWKVCKNLAKEILSSPQFCITRDGKHFHLVGRPNTKVNVLSFLGLATRKAGPAEHTRKPEWAIYTPHIRQLLANGAPKELFVNSLLVKLPRRSSSTISTRSSKGRRKK